MDNGQVTPMKDHVDRAISMMERGARLNLSGIPDDSSLMSSTFTGDVSKAIAVRIRELEAAVGAAFEASAGVVDESDYPARYLISAAVRALTPADATAALDRVREEAEAGERERCLKLARGCSFGSATGKTLAELIRLRTDIVEAIRSAK